MRRRAIAPRGDATGAATNARRPVRFRATIFGDAALGSTLALLATFLGIGVLVNLLVVYIIGQVLAERRQNQERLSRHSE